MDLYIRDCAVCILYESILSNLVCSSQANESMCPPQWFWFGHMPNSPPTSCTAWLYGANKFRTSCCSVPLVLGWGSRVLLSVGAAELHSSSAASLSDLANSLRSIYNKQGKVQDMCSGHRRYITSCKTHARNFLGGQ